MTNLVTFYNFSKFSQLIRKSKKATQLVDEAEKLFLRFGLEKVSVEEICHVAKVSKMTFYRYFQNKIHLFLFIINRIMARAEKRYYKIMAQQVSYQEKVRQIVQMKIEISQDFSYQMLKEYLNSPYPEIKAFIHQKTEEYFNLFLKDFQEAQQRGEIRKNIKPEFILYILNRLVDFVGDENLLQYYSYPQELIEELINFFFFGILSTKTGLSLRNHLQTNNSEGTTNQNSSPPENNSSSGSISKNKSNFKIKK